MLWTPPDDRMQVAARLAEAHAVAIPPEWQMTPAEYLPRFARTLRSGSPRQQHRHADDQHDPAGDGNIVVVVGVASVLLVMLGMAMGAWWAVLALGAAPLARWAIRSAAPLPSPEQEHLPPLDALLVLDDTAGVTPETLHDLETTREQLQRPEDLVRRRWWEVVGRACRERDAHLAHQRALRGADRTQAPAPTATAAIIAPPLSWSPPATQPPPPTPTHPPTHSGSSALWSLARDRHERVVEAWTTMVTDPLNALSHSSLFDTSNTWTAAFIGIYGQASDFIAVHGTEVPDDPSLIDSYAALSREVETAWQSALIRAERSGFDWLPAQERADADRARRLLVLASDEAASLAERANAAQKAAELLRRIHSFVLPRTAMHEVEARGRLELG